MWFDIHFHLKDPEFAEVVAELMRESDLFESIWEGNEYLMSGSTSEYYDPEMEQLYRAVTPYIDSAEGSGETDDRDRWKIAYENGHWFEYEGILRWEDPKPTFL